MSVITFVIWSLKYVFAHMFGSGDHIDIERNQKSLAFNFAMTSSGHLWFVYMLSGVFILMPMISPWVEKLSRKEEKRYLFIWTFATVLPLLQPLAQSVLFD